MEPLEMPESASRPVPSYPINTIRFAIAAMVLSLLSSAYLTWRMGNEIKQVMRSQVEVVAGAERLQHYGSVLELSIRAVVTNGDVSAAARYRLVQPQVRRTLNELRGALQLRENVAALRRVDRADLALVAMEYQALDLASRGNVQEAGSLFNSERYAHLLQIYSSGLQAIEARSEAYVQAMESKVAWYLKVILGLSFVACGLIALGWAALVRPARRWGDQLNEAREEADRARRQVEEQQAGLEDLNRKFFDQARVDPLTKLGTRLKFNEDVETLWQRIVRYGERYGAIMCDIDNFKQYNDTYGHIAGDQILRQVADALSAVCRGGDEIYRFGGEEFLVILPNATLAGSAASAERYRAAVERLSIPHSGSAAGIVTISMGVACSDACDATTIDAWLHEADIALYEAKRTGRNRVETRPLVPETSGPSL